MWWAGSRHNSEINRRKITVLDVAGPFHPHMLWYIFLLFPDRPFLLYFYAFGFADG